MNLGKPHLLQRGQEKLGVLGFCGIASNHAERERLPVSGTFVTERSHQGHITEYQVCWSLLTVDKPHLCLVTTWRNISLRAVVSPTLEAPVPPIHVPLPVGFREKPF